MADRPDPDDTNDRHKNELILRWLEDVQTANQQVPRIPDRGLISNPAATSYNAHIDPIAVIATTHSSNQQPLTQSLDPCPPAHHHNNQTTNSQRKLCSLPSNKSNSFSHLTSSLSHLPRQPSVSKSEGNVTSTHQQSPLVAAETIVSSHSVDPSVSTTTQKDYKGQQLQVEKSKETVLDKKGKSKEEFAADEQHLRELRSQTKIRQSSLSPLPLPTVQPSLPTFNLSNIGNLSAKRNRLTKKLPTVTGVRQLQRPVVKRSQVQEMKLLRATTSPSELLTLKNTRSAPCSPKPSRAEDSRKRAVLKEEEIVYSQSDILERRRSFSHDDVSQLEHLSGQRNVGGVSPAASFELSNGDAPSTQNSLVAEEGSSKDEQISDDSIDKAANLPFSDEAPVSGDNEGNPSNQCKSPAGSGADSDDKSSYSHQLPSKQLDVHQEDQRTLEKMMSSAVCPISPPSVLSPRPPHSPLVRQRHVSRSPSPTHSHTPSTSPYHKSRHSSSNSGTESENLISKHKLKLLDESLTFSFDTSEDSDLTKLSKQPKFLLKKTFTPGSSCPLSPPSLLSSHCSPSSSLSQYLSQRHHSHPYSTANPPHIGSSSICSNPSSVTHQVTTSTSKALQSKSHAVLTEQLSLRRGSTPVTLSLLPAGPPPPPLFKTGSGLSTANTRSSPHSILPFNKPAIGSTQCDKTEVLPHIEDMEEHSSVSTQKREESFRLHKGVVDYKPPQRTTTGNTVTSQLSSELDKGSVNRQDSGIGTLSITSNKCDFRMY